MTPSTQNHTQLRTDISSPDRSSIRNQLRFFWIMGPYRDLSLIIGSPLIVYAMITIAQTHWSATTISSGVMIWAIGHHLPGMMRAYGDPQLFSRFRTRLVLAPIFLFLVTFVSFSFSLNGIVAVAGVWGWWHYLMQTYGFARIYEAKAGSFSATTRWLDFAMCFSWFGAAIVLNDNALFGFITNFYNSGASIPSPDSFATLKTSVTVLTILVTVIFLVNWSLNIRAGVRPNPVKLILMATTFAYFWYSTATVTRIVVAYAFFELFHDVQYLTIVWVFNRNRVKKDRSLGGFTRFLFRPRAVFLVMYLIFVFAYGSLDYVSKLVSPGTLQQALFSCFLTSTLMHYYLDGFIWKLREPKTKSNLDITSTTDKTGKIWIPGGLRHGLLWSLLVLVLLGTTYAELSKRISKVSESPSEIRNRIFAESQKWAEIMPNSVMANFYAGLACESQGDYPAAKRRYERAQSIFPEYDAANLALNRLRVMNPQMRPNDALPSTSKQHGSRSKQERLSQLFKSAIQP